VPAVELPVDWNEQQMLAVAATQRWIRREQSQMQGNGEDLKFTYSCYFAAALSDCPAVTTAFHADPLRCFCFCPCSAQMGVWRSNRLSAKEEGVLFGGILKCSNQQFTPDELVQHCQETMGNSVDMDSRFLHSVFYKYLESLMGETHEAFYFPAVEHTKYVFGVNRIARWFAFLTLFFDDTQGCRGSTIRYSCSFERSDGRNGPDSCRDCATERG
jgi:hypothetical protein